jgi:hypothetical protein
MKSGKPGNREWSLVTSAATLKTCNPKKLFGTSVNPNWIAQRFSKARQFDFHNISILQRHALTEAKGIRAEEMNMGVPCPAVRWIFEMMMFQIRDRMRHVFLSGRE